MYGYGVRNQTNSYGTNYNTNNEIKIRNDNDGPLDTVKQIVWNKYNINDRQFVTCGWDGYVRYYSIIGNSSEEIIRNWDMFLQHPIFSVDMNADGIIFAGLATGDVCAIHMGNNGCVKLGTHNAPVCKVFWVDKFSMAISLGFDNMMKFWGLQQTNETHLMAEFQLPEKTHTAAFEFPYLLIGSATQNMAIISLEDPKNLKIPDYYKVSTTGVGDFSKFTCSSISAIPQKKYEIGTTDGRNIYGEFTQYHGTIKADSGSKISRVQKQDVSGYQKGILGQVNTVLLGSHNGSTFTFIGGTFDCSVYNMYKSERAKDIRKSSTSTNSSPTTAAAISPDNKIVVYATGNDWCYGISSLENLKRPKIFAFKNSHEELASFIQR